MFHIFREAEQELQESIHFERKKSLSNAGRLGHERIDFDV